MLPPFQIDANKQKTMNHILKHTNLSALLLALILGINHGATLMAQDDAQPESQAINQADAHSPAAEEAAVKTAGVLDLKMNAIDGQEVDLAVYKGKVVVVVNTASKCGFTRQYKQLEKIHKKHHEQGLVILGFPCNQFGGQEPGEEKEIVKFCEEKFGVTFDLFAKSDVNGEERNELYKSLCDLDLQPKGKGDVSWNFEKFVISRAGQPVGRFASRVSPTDDEFVSLLKQELAKEAPAAAATPAVTKE